MEAGIKQMTASRWAATYVLGYSYVARAPIDLGEGGAWELPETRALALGSISLYLTRIKGEGEGEGEGRSIIFSP